MPNPTEAELEELFNAYQRKFQEPGPMFTLGSDLPYVVKRIREALKTGKAIESELPPDVLS